MTGGRRTEADTPVVPSVRLVQILRTYCGDLRPAGLHDLRTSLRDGRYPWLRRDLAEAIRGTDSAALWWSGAVGAPTTIGGGSSRRHVRAEQRRVWRSLFPGEPFPS